MNWEMVSAMCGVSVGVSALMAVFVSLMIRSSIAEATNKITLELHYLIKTEYVRKDVYHRDLLEVKAAIKWMAGEMRSE